MGKGQNIFLLLIVAILVIGVLAYFSGAERGGAGGIGSKNGEVIKCSVNVQNSLLASMKISSASCQRDNCGLFDTLSIFGTEGNLKMKINGALVDSESVSFTSALGLPTTGTKSFELKSSCIPKGSTATIELIRDDGKLLDSRSGL